MEKYTLLLDRLKKIIKSQQSINNKLKEICRLLNTEIHYYNWVGYYFANHTNKTLYLGPYVRAPTDHTVIPFGKGICGQVAESNQNFVVPNVSVQTNYIACSLTIKSEIIVPLFVNGKMLSKLILIPMTSIHLLKKMKCF